MRLRHVEVFHAVMVTGSVSGAARLINVTQPAVSRMLQHAEVQLGFALFQRVGGRLVPTREATLLYPRIESVFEQLEDVHRLAGNLRHGLDGHELRMLSVLALSYEVLPRALKLFQRKHPKVTVNVSSLHSDQIVSALVLQEADVGFAFGSTQHPALLQTTLKHSQVVCAAPKGMLPAALVTKGCVTLADLVDLPVVGLDIQDPLGWRLSHACRDADVHWKTVISVQTYHACLAMAHHGVGVALMDEITAASADAARVDVLKVVPEMALRLQVMQSSAKPLSVPAKFMVKCMGAALDEVLGPADPAHDFRL